MSALKNLIDRISSGETDVYSALPEFRKVLRFPDRSRATEDLTLTPRERALAPFDETDTFSEVHAAWKAGELTDDQYQTLFGVKIEMTPEPFVDPTWFSVTRRGYGYEVTTSDHRDVRFYSFNRDEAIAKAEELAGPAGRVSVNDREDDEW